MDATASNFSNRSNAKRAAEKMIAKGTAPDSTTQSCGLCGRKERVCRHLSMGEPMDATASNFSN
ncbi:MAG TPA: hypothetical protein VNN75_01045, partial [Stellaceae bacterium]|nr:hypothetical protein [Stellaceae bacterium]